MNKKKLFLGSSSLAVLAVAGAITLSSGQVTGIVSQGAAGGEWVHYARKEATATEKGIREYWVQCGGDYQFTNPGVAATDATEYNTEQFAANDDRWIYPATLEAQDVLMTDTTKALSLGDYASMTVASIKAGTIDLGTNPAALDVTGFAANHKDDGEKMVVVKGMKDGLEYAVFVPTTFVTDVIGDSAKWKSTVVPKVTDTTVYGYYKVTASFTTDSVPAWISGWDKAVFSGTIDGGNNTITLGQAAYGQFYVCNGATIKNITLANNWWRRTTASYSLICQKSIASNYINVKTTITGVKPEEIDTPYTPAANYGYLFGNGGAQRNSFVDCEFDFKNYDMPCLLSHSNNNTETNTFSNCLLKCYSYTELYSVNGGVVKTATGLKIKTSSVTPLELDRQDILVNSADAQSISIAGTEYASDQIVSIKVGDYDFGTNLSQLVIPQALKSSPIDHGEKTMYLVVMHGGEETRLSLPVTLVTGEIKTADDIYPLRGVNTGVAAKVYGYYIVPANATLTISGNASYGWDGAGNGFYGTIDGRGHTLSYNTAGFTGGLFGTTCVGAVIKNITLENLWFSGGWGVCMVAHTMFTTTLQDVTFKISAGGGVTATGNGLICSGAIYTNKFTNVKVESAVNLGTLIAQDANATKSTFTNCTVKAPAVLGYVGSDLTTPGWSVVTA